MNIILALNSFKNYIDSIEACNYLKKKIIQKKGIPNKIKIFPMADGGEYTAKVLSLYCKSKEIKISTYDIFKKKISINVIEFRKNNVFIGTSDILGARNYNMANINPSEITSYGLGYALKNISKKYKNIYVGMGGTLIADAGAGAVEGFGGKFTDLNNNEIKNIIPKKFRDINKVIKPNIFKKNNIYFLMDGKTYFKDLDIPLGNKIGSKFKRKKSLIKKFLIKNIKTYFSKISNRKIDNIKYSANAGAIWLSFCDLRNSFALNGAKFISEISGINKYNQNKNILITGEGIFDNSLIGKGPVYLCNKLNKIKKNYYLTGKFLPKIKIFKKGIFYKSKYLSSKHNINNLFLLKKSKLTRKNVFIQLDDFSKKFLKLNLV